MKKWKKKICTDYVSMPENDVDNSYCIISK